MTGQYSDLVGMRTCINAHVGAVATQAISIRPEQHLTNVHYATDHVNATDTDCLLKLKPPGAMRLRAHGQ